LATASAQVCVPLGHSSLYFHRVFFLIFGNCPCFPQHLKWIYIRDPL